MLEEGAKIHPELKMNRLVYGALKIDSQSCCTVRAHQTVHVSNCCNVNQKAGKGGRQTVTHSFTQWQKTRLFLCCFFFLTTLAGSAVLRINKSFFAVGFLCAAGAAVSAEGLSRCNKAFVTRSEVHILSHFDRCSCGGSDTRALDSKQKSSIGSMFSLYQSLAYFKPTQINKPTMQLMTFDKQPAVYLKPHCILRLHVAL